MGEDCDEQCDRPDEANNDDNNNNNNNNNRTPCDQTDRSCPSGKYDQKSTFLINLLCGINLPMQASLSKQVY